MTLQHVDILFKLIVFLVCDQLSRVGACLDGQPVCGDPTARMLGRITLNPIKHIDPLGTILLPLWRCLPTSRCWDGLSRLRLIHDNFHRPVLDDILTSRGRQSATS